MIGRVGIDFDNTIVSYDAVFHRTALSLGLIDPTVAARKSEVRGAVRALHGEKSWTRLQGVVYSEGMAQAEVSAGFLEFVSWLKSHGGSAAIISHKTSVAASGEPLDLIGPAVAWLRRHRFLSPRGLGFELGRDIFFEQTRREKMRRIASCHCGYFIDDLPEVFVDPDFPDHVLGILYDPALAQRAAGVPVVSLGGWQEIRRFFEMKERA